ncbi:MAG: SDR family NAD(P)-dependent oxidoreductase [Acidimicrobiales bacterium]
MTAAVVTGASRGLGAGICVSLAQRGIDVVINHRHNTSADAAEQTAQRCRQVGGRAVVLAADVAQPGQCPELAEAALEQFGSLDIWVNNAGVSTIGPLLDTGDDTFRHLFDTNVLGVLHGMQAAVTVMKAAGRPGRIINVASDAALVAFPLLGAYSATKFAVRAMTQTAALELAALNITVNAVCPGTAETDMNEQEWATEMHLTGHTRDTVRQRYLADIPVGRFVTPADVGEVVAWLATDPGGFVTGQSICVNGATVLH